MTKLMEWFFFGIIFLSVWIPLITKQINHYLLEEYFNIILYFPFIVIFTFGVYAVAVVLWRVYTFNNCEDAAVELKKQIEEAKADLIKRGFHFEEEKT